MQTPPKIDLETVVERYEALVLDAYGVLVHSEGAFPGARECIAYLRNQNVPFWIVTNDASRLPETAAEKYRSSGLEIPSDIVLTSGMLLEPFAQRHGLEGASTAVLGTDDSRVYAERAELEPVDPRTEAFDVLVLGDDAGFPFRETVDAVLTHLIRRFDRGSPVELVLPNPDLMFQKDTDRYGFAVGAITEMFEAVLAERFPDLRPTFERLGKPHTPIFEEAVERAGTDEVAVLGDQLATDIAGAKRAELDAILVTGGITNLEASLSSSEVRPDYVMEEIAPSREDDPSG